MEHRAEDAERESRRPLERTISCEVFVKEFYARGNDEYLTHWANEVDWMAAEGWQVVECCRDPESAGFWTVVFGRTKTRTQPAAN
jgi:hypothetical protein